LLSGSVVFAIYNCFDNREQRIAREEYGVKKFPSLRYFPAGLTYNPKKAGN
jgi:hypothetical protein